MSESKNLASRLILLPIVVLTVLVGILVFQVQLLQSNSARVDHADRVVSRMNGLLRSIIDQETGLRGYLLTGQSEFLEPYTRGRAESSERFAALESALAGDPGQLESLRTLELAHQDWEASAINRLDVRHSQQQIVEDGLIAKHRMDRIRVLAKEFIRREESARAQRSLHSTFLSGVTLVTFSLLAFIASATTVLFIRRLKKSEETFRDLALRYSEGKEALRETEGRYRTLFDSIDEGFCIIELIFNPDGKPVDYRFLETNPSFEKQTGMANPQGKTMREFAPEMEQYWFDIYGRIAVTGEASRLQTRRAIKPLV